ncbi:MAG: hypothetical protein IT384_19475 [Deltaproteobacteria bacterium]|nr:hypothetical protein [Deltaproteobacteria bacterium]
MCRRSGLRALAALLAAVAASCRAAPIWLLPDLDRSSYVLVIGEGREQRVFAGPYGDSLEAMLAGEGPIAVRLFTYDRGLDALRLEAGSIELPLTGPGACEVVRPREVFALEVRDPKADVESASWKRVDPPPASWLDALVPDRAQRCSSCTRFAQQTTSLVPAITATQGWIVDSVAWLDSGAALVAGSGIGSPVEWLRATPLGAQALRGCSRGGDSASTIAALGENRFLIGRDGPSVERIAVDEAQGTCTSEERLFLPRPEPSPPELAFSVKFQQTSTRGLEIFVLTSRGSVERYDGAEWVRLTQVEVDPVTLPRGAKKGDLALNAQGHLAAVVLSQQIAGWSPDRGAVRRELALSHADPLSYVVWVPALGWVVGGGNGAMGYAREIVGVWSELGEPTFEYISSIAPFGDGMIVVQDRGPVFEWQPGAGWCPNVPTLGADSRGRATLVSPDQQTILIGDLLGDGQPQQPALLLWLKVVSGPP